VDDVLARQAGDVRAGPTDVLPLDHRDPLSVTSQRPRQQFAGLAAAEHDEVIFFNVGHDLLPVFVYGWWRCEASQDHVPQTGKTPKA
jgi:hypothetical protein